MKNMVQRGESLTAIAPSGGVVSGDVVIVGDTIGIAYTTAAVGAEVELAVVGVFTLPKATGAINLGVKVYWDGTNKVVTTTASGNTLMGRAWSKQLSADATVDVKLTPTV